MTHSALWLSQLQFFSSLSFMAIFFAMELGLAWLLLIFRLRTLSGLHSVWLASYRFWVRVFALTVVLGFASSLPILIQLGSLWPGFSSRTSEVSGPLIALALAVTLVFKSGFLGLMLFAYRTLPHWLHTIVVAIVAIGSTVTVSVLIALSSWMQVPTGVQWQDKGYLVTDWYELLTGPAFVWQLAVFLLLSMVVACCFVMAVTAAKSLRRPADESERRAFRLVLWVLLLSTVLLVAAVWGYGQMVVQYEPLKALATVARWHANTEVFWPFIAYPAGPEAGNLYSYGWRGMGAMWIPLSETGEYLHLEGQSSLPPVALVFFSFRIALLLGAAILLVSVLTCWRVRPQHYDPSALSVGWRRVLIAMGAAGWLLLVVGLLYHFSGALPYMVNGSIKFTDVFSDVPFESALASLVSYAVVYGFCLVGFFMLVRYIVRYGVVPVARRRGRA
ncbi:cytochrome ubiquinol oxidase subunit I [Alcaligenaceae bacterium 429]|uniref:cytochrome ubiquinol oxidase subunit I n=1 Tax=Paenalcaligenes sp. Me52 TaxID=3392038 RepID=UPI001092226C|nr:cytochrome ubiquinol oxidase subunit I [Alcaligenaceae bacterium 429]